MASDLNSCSFIGRLGRDPETRYTPSGDAVTSFSIAVGESWKERVEIVAREPPENLPIRVTLQRTYKLADVKEGRATIEFRTAILTLVRSCEGGSPRAER